jgi:hypothetical protein
MQTISRARSTSSPTASRPAPDHHERHLRRRVECRTGDTRVDQDYRTRPPTASTASTTRMCALSTEDAVRLGRCARSRWCVRCAGEREIPRDLGEEVREGHRDYGQHHRRRQQKRRRDHQRDVLEGQRCWRVLAASRTVYHMLLSSRYKSSSSVLHAIFNRCFLLEMNNGIKAFLFGCIPCFSC